MKTAKEPRICVILTWWQLTDGVADHGFFRGLPYRAALLALGRAYRKARARRPGFDERTRAHLEELARLEGERCPSMDRAADAFAALLAGAAEEEPDPVRRRVLEQLLYHLGRWIYLVDAADDLKKDVKSGSYNPLVYRFHAECGTQHSGGRGRPQYLRPDPHVPGKRGVRRPHRLRRRQGRGGI